MAASKDARKIAADARRAAAQGDEARATEVLRQSLKSNYDRGREVGREEMRQELSGVDSRRSLLEVAAELTDLVASRISSISNSETELRACRESAAILRDASKPDAEIPPKAAAAKTKPKARSKG